MGSPATTIFLLTALGVCKGLVLVGEDKRQGLIPFPRVGRTFNPWLQSAIFRQDLDDDDGLSLPEDLFSVRYTRGIFTPRLGRRKRSTNDDEKATETSAHTFGGNSNVIDLGELLRRTPWAIVAYKDGVDKKMAFSPRLGRAMTPRLGRKRSDGSNDAHEEPEKRAAFAPRLGRAYPMEESNEGDSPFEVATRAAFSPRLGRAGPGYLQTRSAFAPRLGRSDPNLGTPNNSGDSSDQQSV